MLYKCKRILAWCLCFGFVNWAQGASERWDASDLPFGSVSEWASQGPLSISAALPQSGVAAPARDAQGVFFDGSAALQISASDNFLSGASGWTATVVFKAEGGSGEGGATRPANPQPDDLREWFGNAALAGIDLPGGNVGDWGILLNAQDEIVMGSGGSPSTGYVWQGEPLADGRWHAVTVSFDAARNNRTLYVDGRPVHGQQEVPVRSPEGAINFACNVLDSANERAFFTGHLSTVILADEALPLGAVLSLHDSLGFSAPRGTLYDGESFDGWGMSIQDNAGSVIGDDIWEVTSQGYAFANGSGNRQSGLYTLRQDYGNYELTFQYRWTENKSSANSGVWIHGGDEFVDSRGAFPAAIEMQLRQGREGDLLRKQTYLEAEPGWPTDSDAGNPDHRIIRRADPGGDANGVWHSVRIVAQSTQNQGHAISVWINDVFVNRGINCERGAGRIVFQAEGSDIQFRNIALVEDGQSRIDPAVNWNAPASIVYGEPLSSSQLSASSSVAGSFSYSPGLGTVLEAGSGQTLEATFTPSDLSRYNTVSGSVRIDVAPAALTLRADDKSRFYGRGNPSLSYSASGLVNGDSVADLDAQPTLATLADAESPLGDYAISISGATSSNYTIAQLPGTLTVYQGVWLSTISDVGGELRLEWRVGAEELYEVERSVDLETWERIGSTTTNALGVGTFVIDESSLSGSAFYRLAFE